MILLRGHVHSAIIEKMSDEEEIFLLASQEYEASVKNLATRQSQLPRVKPVTDLSDDLEDDDENICLGIPRV